MKAHNGFLMIQRQMTLKASSATCQTVP